MIPIFRAQHLSKKKLKYIFTQFMRGMKNNVKGRGQTPPSALAGAKVSKMRRGTFY